MNIPLSDIITTGDDATSVYIYKTKDGDVVALSAREVGGVMTIEVTVNSIDHRERMDLVDKFTGDSGCDFSWGVVRAVLEHGGPRKLVRQAKNISRHGL